EGLHCEELRSERLPLGPALGFLQKLRLIFVLSRSTDFATYRDDDGLIDKAKARKLRPNGIGDIARRKMGVMLLGHPRILVAELLCDHAEGNAAHREQRGMRVPQDVERWGRGQPSTACRLSERSLLM